MRGIIKLFHLTFNYSFDSKLTCLHVKTGVNCGCPDLTDLPKGKACVCESSYLSLLSRAMAQTALQRWSRLLLVSCSESLSTSMPPAASPSRSRTSHRLSTDATPSVCCSMSLCSTCTDTWTHTASDVASDPPDEPVCYAQQTYRRSSLYETTNKEHT